MTGTTEEVEKEKEYKLLKPLHYKGKLIDPEVDKGAVVKLYQDQADNLKKLGVI